MHLLVDGLTSIAQEAWLHPELRLHHPAIVRMARALVDGKQNSEALVEILGQPEIAALQWLNDHTIRPGLYRIPFLAPDYCDKLVVEADKMGETIGYEPNDDEELPYQIPELVLGHLCPSLFQCLQVLFDSAICPLTTILMGQQPAIIRTIQFARYEPAEVGHGNWHVDIDSDITAVVSLQPDKFEGGGTDVRTGPLSKITVEKLPQGHALLFHGKTTLHRGRKVESGRRDLLVFWTEVKE